MCMIQVDKYRCFCSNDLYFSVFHILAFRFAFRFSGGCYFIFAVTAGCSRSSSLQGNGKLINISLFLHISSSRYRYFYRQKLTTCTERGVIELWRRAFTEWTNHMKFLLLAISRLLRKIKVRAWRKSEGGNCHSSSYDGAEI